MPRLLKRSWKSELDRDTQARPTYTRQVGCSGNVWHACGESRDVTQRYEAVGETIATRANRGVLRTNKAQAMLVIHGL
jgi:ribosomal protein L3